MKHESELKEKLDREILFNQIVAHDLRNIICNATMLVGLLVREVKGQEKAEKMANQVRETLWRMDRLIHQLLELGRIKSNMVELNKTSFKASDLKSYVDLFDLSVKSKGLDFKSSFPSDLTLSADKDMICQVIDNLISNAIKHTSSGSIEVWCDHGNPHGTIHVKDTGVGIESEDIPNLFNPYWQKKKGVSSLGIGLYICKSFVEANGGALSVKSKVGEGTTFSFTVPTIHQ